MGSKPLKLKRLKGQQILAIFLSTIFPLKTYPLVSKLFIKN